MSRCPQLVSASLLAVLLAGCSGGGDKPAALPTLTPAPSPTATVAPVPPQAEPVSALGLDSFVRFYFQQVNLAYNSADVTSLRHYSDPACESCNNFIRSAASSPDELVAGETFAVTDVAAPPVVSGGTIVEIFGKQPARRLVKPDGTLIRLLPAGPAFHFEVNVLRRSDGWVVRGVREAK